jgi:MFS family permease
MKENRLKIIYYIAIPISFVFMLLIMNFGGFTLNITSLIFFYAIKFLAGFGLIISIANGFFVLLDKTSEKLDKRATNIVVIVEILVPFIFIGYAIYQIISSYFENSLFSQDTFPLIIDIIMYVYGILSLLLSLYILPLIKDAFYKGIEMSKFVGFKKRAKKAARKVKKKYYALRGEYAMLEKQDHLTIRDLLGAWRNKFAVNFLIIIALGSLIFTPIAFICVMYWLRLYVLFRIERKNYERIALLIGISIVGIIALTLIAPFLNLPFYVAISQYFWTINIFYLLGIILASYIFLKRLLSLRGITIQEFKMKKKDKQIDKLEQEKVELKKQLDNKE